MKKIIFNFSSLIFILFLLTNIMLHSNLVSSSIALAFKIWKENLFPFLFPMFVLSEILMSIGFIEIIGSLFGKLFYKLFKCKKECVYVFFMSMLTGFPSSAKYIKGLFDKNILNEKEASKILMFSHFSNPLFIIGTISSTLLNQPKLAILIIISHYLPNVIIGLIIRNYNSNKKEKAKSSSYNFFHHLKDQNNKLSVVLGNSIVNSINTLLLILGTISIFLIITSILNNLFNFKPLINTILNGIIEMSQGLKYTSLLNIPLRIKTVISVIIISFGGLSVHLQTMSILSETKIKYFPFLLSRILHSIISGILAYYLFYIFGE